MKISLTREDLSDGACRWSPSTQEDAALLPQGYELRGRVLDGGGYAVVVPASVVPVVAEEQRNAWRMLSREMARFRVSVLEHIDKILAVKEPIPEIKIKDAD